MTFIDDAESISRIQHQGQMRKWTQTPYFFHTKNVAMLVKQYEGTDDQIAAAYLHDVIEDTSCTIYHLESYYPDTQIPSIVSNCTDTPGLKGNARRKAKFEFIETLALDDPAILVMLCDTIDNTFDTYTRVLYHGPVGFEGFSAGLGIIKYYRYKGAALCTKTTNIKAVTTFNMLMTALALLFTDEEWFDIERMELW